VAVIVARVEVVTDLVVTLKPAVVLPAATVTEAGTVADALLLDRETKAPPLGAAALSVMVPLTEVPPVTLAGVSDTDESVALVLGVTVRPAVLLVLP
jgi:hypothetical protein